jgi:hypothetical protein
MADNLKKIETTENAIRDAVREVLLIEPDNASQAELQEDLSDALTEIQNKELLAVRKAFE